MHLYAVKGCSHCDLRESCDLKDSRANLSETVKVVKETSSARTRKPAWTWKTFCLDFFREPRE